MRGKRLVAVIAASGALLAAPAAIAAQVGDAPSAPALDAAQPAPILEEVRSALGTPAPEVAFGDPLGPPSIETLRTSGKSAKPTATASATRRVEIGDYFYEPDELTIKTGDKVVWTNDGTVPEGHTVTGDTFDSEVIEEGDSYSHKFPVAGTFDYVCALHENMDGTVIVKERPDNDGGSDPDGDDDPVDDSGDDDDGGDDDGGNTGGVSAGEDSGSGDSSAGETDSGVDIPLASTGLDAGLLAIIGLNVLLLGVLVRIRFRGRAV